MLLPEIDSWDEWGHIFTDIKLWTPVIRKICDSENISVNNIRGSYPGTNAVFILDDRYVIKISPQECHEDHKNEVVIGKALVGRVPVPKILRTGIFKDRIDWPYIIMEYKKGEAIRDVRDRIPKEKLMDLYSHIGRVVKEIHNTNLSSLSCLDTSSEGWVKFINKRKTEIVKELTKLGILPDNVIEEAAEFLNEFSVADNPDIVLLNADLTEDHLLLEEKDGKWNVSALIDLADGMVGEREYEWVALWFGLLDRNIEGFKAFIASYDEGINIDKRLMDRVMAFTLLHRFARPIISTALENIGNPAVTSLRGLQDILWFQI